MKEIHFRRFSNFAIALVLTLSLCTAILTLMNTNNDELTDTTVNSAIYNGNKNTNKVALMFNVYENTENVLKIKNILLEYGFVATFFVGGKWVEKNGDALIKLYSAGMEIGNHGYLHRDHATLSQSKNRDEILLTEKLIDAYLSSIEGYQNCHLFAPPSGSMGNNMFDATNELGYQVIMWTRDTIDWRDHDSDLIYSRAINGITAGDLILMHPTDCTVNALPLILYYIKTNGLIADKVSNVI